MLRSILIFLCCLVILSWAASYSVHEEEEEEEKDVVVAAESGNSEKRQLFGYDLGTYLMLYVDFGAETGDNGAFSWHATYPV